MIERLAYALSLMRAAPDGDGSLLDNTILLYTSEISHPAKHDDKDMPVILAGALGAG